MATASPSAVSTSASLMPADTDERPPEPVDAMPWNALMMPTTVPRRPTNGRDRPDRREHRESASQIGADLFHVALEVPAGALGGREAGDVGGLGRVPVRRERRAHDARQVPRSVALRRGEMASMSPFCIGSATADANARDADRERRSAQDPLEEHGERREPHHDQNGGDHHRRQTHVLKNLEETE